MKGKRKTIEKMVDANILNAKETERRVREEVMKEQREWKGKDKGVQWNLAKVQTMNTETQTEVKEIEVQVQEEKKEQERRQEKKSKAKAKDSIQEDVEMKDGSASDNGLEDLSRNEQEEDEAIMTTPPVTKKQTARRQAVKRVGKQSPPTQTPPKNQPREIQTKAIVAYGVLCQRSMAQVIQYAGGKGIIGARWLLGRKCRIGKTTSSVVLFFEEAVKLVGAQCRLRGCWLPCEAYDFDRGRRRDTGSW